MLLVIIAGLVSYIVAERWNRQRQLQRLAAEGDLAIVRFQHARLVEEQARHAEELVRKVHDDEKGSGADR
jgi:hypothetical protein